MPADKFSFKPTPAQMSYGDIVVHLSQGNDFLCGTIGGMKAPTRSKVAATESKEALVAALIGAAVLSLVWTPYPPGAIDVPGP